MKTSSCLDKSGKFTKKAVAGYLKSGCCPYCEEFNVAPYRQEFDGNTFSQKMRCENKDCLKSWWEIYEMQTIEVSD